jgi:hypothetical protein
MLILKGKPPCTKRTPRYIKCVAASSYVAKQQDSSVSGSTITSILDISLTSIASDWVIIYDIYYLPCPLYFLKLRLFCLLVGRDCGLHPMEVRFRPRCFAESYLKSDCFAIILFPTPSMPLMPASSVPYPHG